MDSLFEFRAGTTPLLVDIPHGGTAIPAELEGRMTAVASRRPDTDWHLSRLYDFAELKSASWLAAKWSRYVIDLNRPSDNSQLYPGQNTTGLCPATTFAGEPLYREGEVPGSDEISERVDRYWQPYHAKLAEELERLVDRFGFAVLLDGHSIAGEIPRLFQGRLPDFNFGTNHGASCSGSLQERIERFSERIEGYSSVVNGRFVGGYITRQYGTGSAVHAVQLELVQATYMDETTFQWNERLAGGVRPVIREFVSALQSWIGDQS